MAIDCLVINLTRFGDLIQSQPLLHDLKAAGLRTGLVCQENFAKALPLLAALDYVATFPGAGLLRDLDHNWQEAFIRLRTWADTVKQEIETAFVLNLTATIPARLLASLLAPSQEKLLGFALDEEGFGANRGSWATFLSGTTSCRQNAVFNIADMFRMMAGPIVRGTSFPNTPKKSLGFGLNPPRAEHLAEAEALLSAPAYPKEMQERQGFFAFQLGASATCRQWPVPFFARLGDLLYEKARICPVLTGTPAELCLEEEYRKSAHHPFLSAIGKTSLPLLAALLTKVKCLVSNDTGTLHLAAGLGTPSLSFFLATAQPWDTAPYLPDCLCLEPLLDCHPCSFQTPCQNKHICRERIAPEAVAEILLNWLDGKSLQDALAISSPLEARVYATRREPSGFADITLLKPLRADDRTHWIREQRHFWRQLLDEEKTEDPCQESDHQEIEGLQACSEAFKTRLVPVLEQIVHLLKALIEQSHLLTKSQTAGTLFLRNCTRLENLFLEAPELTSLAFFWKELRTDHGQDIASLRVHMQRLVRHLTQLLEKTRNGTNNA